MFLYGLVKVFKSQFSFPSLYTLTQTYGDSSPMGLAWNFMGYSDGYTIFAGCAEVLAGALLLARRTTTLGALVSVGVLANIAAMNFCYDIPVKLFSSTLLLMAVYLLGTDLRRNIGLTDDIPDFNLFDIKPIYSRARMLPPSKISGTTLEKTIIADGCIINASRIERSVIGIRTRIGTGTTIVNTYVMGGDRYQTLNELKEAEEIGSPIMGIGERCYIKNAIIDKNCFIGNDVRLTEVHI